MAPGKVQMVSGGYGSGASRAGAGGLLSPQLFFQLRPEQVPFLIWREGRHWVVGVAGKGQAPVGIRWVGEPLTGARVPAAPS